MKYVLPFVVLTFLFSCKPKPDPLNINSEGLTEKYQQRDSSELEVEPNQPTEKPLTRDLTAYTPLLEGGWALLDYERLLNETHSISETESSLPIFYTSLAFTRNEALHSNRLDWQEEHYVSLSEIAFPGSPVENAWLNITKLTDDTLMIQTLKPDKGWMTFEPDVFTFIKNVHLDEFGETPPAYRVFLKAIEKLEREWLSGNYHVISDTSAWNMTLKIDGSISGHPKAENAVSTYYYGFTHTDKDLMSFRFQLSDTLMKQSWLITESGKDFFKLQQVKNITEEDQPIELLTETLELRRVTK